MMKPRATQAQQRPYFPAWKVGRCGEQVAASRPSARRLTFAEDLSELPASYY